VVRTHYPLTREIGIAINDANAWLEREGSSERPTIPRFIKEVVEEIARQARTNSHVNQASGVSVRMSIASLENVVSNAERRALLLNEPRIVPRPADLWHMLPSARGKLELVMTEDEGQEDALVSRIVGDAIQVIFAEYFDPKEFRPLVDAFEAGKTVELGDMMPAQMVLEKVERLPLLKQKAEELIKKTSAGESIDAQTRNGYLASAVEFILEGLHTHNKLNKNQKGMTATFRR
jgi:magnesium chelatase subunit I